MNLKTVKNKCKTCTMELDDYISHLRNDLGSSLNQARDELRFCPECGTRLEQGSVFCPECGTRVISSPDERNDVELPAVGIILTDTLVLAQKYDCERCGVIDMLNGIMQEALEYGVKWHLLDTAVYRPQLGEDPFWLDYNQLISDCIEENGLQHGMKLPVFILGGDDVIPIPMIEDIFGSSDTGQIPCDMSYCFSGNFFSNLWDGDHTIEESDVRNVLGRLPLEDGTIASNIEEDIRGYFKRCLDYYKGGLPVSSVMMTSNSSWLPASRTMSEHLPLVNHAEGDETISMDDMYVAPPVTPDNEEVLEPVTSSMKDAGMLLFNLHGSGEEGMNSFYSDMGEAFSLDMLKYTSAHVFNTVACYGARYHGYARDDSMLLTSFYKHDFLLYAGSLIPVPMTEFNIPDGVEVHEGSGSEHLMPIYCMEQYAGLTAGEAMMKAKLEYFNTFRHLERDDFSLATIQMFSLYGNPILRMQRDESVLQKAKEEHVLPVLPFENNTPVRMKRMQRVMNKDMVSSSLLSDIREAVDAGLTSIHTSIAKDLYSQLGLEPRMLDHIDAYDIPGVEKGYMYTYINDVRAFANKTIVEIDESGHFKRLIKMK